MINLLYAALCLVAGCCLLSLISVRSAHRIAVLEVLIGGPRLGRDIPVRLGIRYIVLLRMEVDGLIDSEPEAPDYGNEWPTGRVYCITYNGRRALGDHDR